MELEGENVKGRGQATDAVIREESESADTGEGDVLLPTGPA